MKLFRFTYKGLWLGGKVIVLAKNLQYAKKKLKNFLTEEDYLTLELEETTDIKEDTKIIYNDNGDY